MSLQCADCREDQRRVRARSKEISDRPVAIRIGRVLSAASGGAMRFASWLPHLHDSKRKRTLLRSHRATLGVWRGNCLCGGWRVVRKRKREIETTALPEVMYDGATGSADFRDVPADRSLSQPQAGGFAASHAAGETRGAPAFGAQSGRRISGSREAALPSRAHLGVERESQPGADRPG